MDFLVDDRGFRIGEADGRTAIGIPIASYFRVVDALTSNGYEKGPACIFAGEYLTNQDTFIVVDTNGFAIGLPPIFADRIVTCL